MDGKPGENVPSTGASPQKQVARAPAPAAARQSGGSTPRGESAGRAQESTTPSLALPKGGGAIRGIGEKFNFNAVTGTGSWSVPIFTSPCRGDAAPQLALSYSSGSGNGPFGLGWDLGVPSIARRTSKNIPTYDGRDVFVLSGTEDLVPDSSSSGTGSATEGGTTFAIQRFRPRTEGLFARIERWTATSGAVHWRSRDKHNTLSIYGASDASRIVDPQNSARVFRWLLERTLDERGNETVYVYKAEDGEGVTKTSSFEAYRNRSPSEATAQKYLKYVRYGNRTTTPSATEPNDWLFELVLDYGEHSTDSPLPDDSGTWSVRADAFSNCRAGFEVRTYRRCVRALMFHRIYNLAHTESDAPAPVLVRATRFDYTETPALSLLQWARQTGYGPGSAPKSLPDVTFGYVDFSLNTTVAKLRPEDTPNLPAGLFEPGFRWMDLDGEGISGVLSETDGAWMYQRNRGEGVFSPSEVVASRPSMANLGGGQQQVMDLGGDGRAYLVNRHGPMAGWQVREADGWSPFRPFREMPNIDWDDPNLKFVDVNGDGFADAFISEADAFVWYPSKTVEGFDYARRVAKALRESDGPMLVFADGTNTVFTADMSGDGLADLVRIRNGEVSYWPNLGYGRFGRQVVMSGISCFDASDRFDPKRIRLGDIDGSGTTDVVYLSADGVKIHYNQSGNSFASPVTLPFPRIDSVSQVTLVDLLGRGTQCLVWSSPLPSDSAAPLRYVDLVGGNKPHLLTTVASGMDSVTTLEYKSSTQFYLADQLKGVPWATKLPFPVHVVSKVTTQDLVSETTLVKTYWYRHGHYDGVEREFRGFGYVEERDAEQYVAAGSGYTDTPPAVSGIAHLPPVVTKTWYHTGHFDKRGQISAALQAEYWGGDSATTYLLDTVLPSGLSPEEAREACRALRGQMLRQEVYADDAAAHADVPYAVTEQNFDIVLAQAQGSNLYAVLWTHPRESIAYHYERDATDPRVVHSFTLDVDDWGNVTESAQVVYARRTPTGVTWPDAQLTGYATVTETQFINVVDDASAFHVGLVCKSQLSDGTFAWPTSGLFAFDDLKTTVDPPSGPRPLTLRSGTQTFFVDWTTTDHPALALGVVQTPALVESFGVLWTPALVHHTRKLATTTTEAKNAYGLADTDAAKDKLLAAGYVTDDSPASGTSYWWALSGVQGWDPGTFFLPTAYTDAYGNAWNIAYDGDKLLVTGVTDPFSCVMHADNDYRVLQPWQLKDPNGNRQALRFDPLGVPTFLWVMGKETESLGEAGPSTVDGDDTDTHTATFDYTFANTSDGVFTPTTVTTKHRQSHGGTDADAVWEETRVYFDGTGREALKKVRCKADATTDPPDPESWVGSGKVIYDNKGNPVKQYEPFFATTGDWETDEVLSTSGVTPILQYDALGRLVRTDFPDGSYSKVELSPWQEKHFDQNDTVADSAWLAAHTSGGTQDLIASKVYRHRNTPTLRKLDSLGRVFEEVLDNTIGDASSRVLYTTAYTYDIEGRVITITDANSVPSMTWTYDRQGLEVAAQSPDTGTVQTLHGVDGLVIWTKVALGHIVTRSYDWLRRLTGIVVDDGTDTRVVEKVFYGIDTTTSAPTVANALGKPILHFDEAGLVRFETYDFEGRLTGQNRFLRNSTDDDTDWNSLSGATASVWSGTPSVTGLDGATAYGTTTTYDAVGRPTSQVTADGKVTNRGYALRGALTSVTGYANVANAGTDTGRTDIVTSIAYNERGQRASIAYGNTTTTTYTYDSKTFRVTEIRTAAAGDSVLRQQLQYSYDPVGNVVHLHDEARENTFFSNESQPPDWDYVYDPLYRLTATAGREWALNDSDPVPDWVSGGSFTPAGMPSSGTARTYVQSFVYDGVGNFQTMQHFVGTDSTASWTRAYTYTSGTNQLAGDTIGSQTSTYAYDAAGNMTRMPHLPGVIADSETGATVVPGMSWDHANRLVQTYASNSAVARYTYDSAGQRVRKVFGGLTWNSTTSAFDFTATKETVYLPGGYEVVRNLASGTVTTEWQMLSVMDDRACVVRVETNTIGYGDGSAPGPVWRYQLENQLGSACLEVSDTGALLTREEYYAYGGTAYAFSDTGFGGSVKRYRYSGKECDSENGLYYFGARYYAAWLGRWTAGDPVFHAGRTPWEFCHGNPSTKADPDGREPQAKTYSGTDAAGLAGAALGREKSAWIQYTGEKLTVYEGKRGDKSKQILQLDATSGYHGYRIAGESTKKDPEGKSVPGPVPQGKWSINLQPDVYTRMAKQNTDRTLKPNPQGGMELIPNSRSPDTNRMVQGEWHWGHMRARLEPQTRKQLHGRENNFYIHDSHKGETHGCVETKSEIMEFLLGYRVNHERIDVDVTYKDASTSTRGKTERETPKNQWDNPPWKRGAATGGE